MRRPQGWPALLLACALAAGAAGAETPPAPAQADAMAARLACPASPNCVNSLGVVGLPPLAYSGDAAQGMARLRAALAGFSEARIDAADGQSLTTIFTTLLGFRDEVVFVFDPAQPVIHFRSRSLLGYHDFGKNRSRMQAVSERFAATPQP